MSCRLHCCWLLLATLGCGGSSSEYPQTFPVTGAVTHAGQPVEGAVVTFHPSASSQSAVGRTDVAGMYSLTTFTPGDGARPGDYQVTIVKYEDINPEELERPESPPLTHLLPEKYAKVNSSALSATVSEGGPNEFDFQLEK